MTKNVTLSVDADVLEAARRYASANHTSINALIREALAAVAARAERSTKAWDALFALADSEGAASGGKRLTRDDLHDR
jgi:hypothetical protein